MRIAIGIFGFLAELLTCDEIKNNIKNALPNCSDGIDIYYFCPSIIHEKDQTELNTEQIEKEYINASLGIVRFQWVKYNPCQFINICKKYGFPIKAETQMYTYRIFSLYYNIKGTIDMIKDSNIKYDNIILIRNDYIRYVKRYDDLFTYNIKEGLYVWRNCGNAEDRVIYGTAEMIYKLSNIYLELPIILKDLTLIYGEGVLRYYINKTFDNSLLYIQSFQPLIVASINREFKRTSEMLNIVISLYNRCECECESND